MRVAYVMLATTFILGSAYTVKAQEPNNSNEARSGCLQLLADTETKYQTVSQHLDREERHGLRTLKSGAVFLARAGEEDACNEVVESIDSVLSSRESQLVNEGVLKPRDERRRRELLRQAGERIGKLETLHAGDLIGADVSNLDDQDLGDVEDIIVHPAKGEASHLLISTGGFLGMGEDFVAVPIGAIGFAPQLDVVIVDMTEDVFEKAPQVTRKQVEGKTQDESWREKTNDYFLSHTRN